MATNYTYKGPEKLVYDANKKRLRTECTILFDRVINEIFNEMTIQFNDALAEGKILEIKGSEDHVKELLRIATKKELGPGNAN